MRAAEVKDALRARHGCGTGSGQWVCVEEAFGGWASGGYGGIDLLAIGAWKTARAPGLRGAGTKVRHALVAYEVKVSRSDMRKELYGYTPGPNVKHGRTRGVDPWPAKQMFAMGLANYLVFAVPAGLLRPDELERREPVEGRGRPLWVPPGVGLVEVTGAGCRVRVEADPMPGRPLNVPETAELIRHAVDPNKLRRARADLAAKTADYDDLSRRYWELKDKYEAVA